MDTNKKQFKKFDFAIAIAIMFGIVLVANFFSYQFFKRVDLTENNDYSISQISKKTIRELDDIINIKVYFSKNLPSQYYTLNQDVKDILDEYQTYSNGKVKIEFIDPESLENPDEELPRLGIMPVQFTVFEKDKRELLKGYLGMIIAYADKQEVIPVVSSTYDLEYNITMAIKKVLSEQMATVGILTSHGSLSSNSEIRSAVQKLAELYSVTPVDLKTSKVVPTGISTLILPGPKEEFSEEELKAIDKHVIGGGELVVLMDGVNLDESLKATVNKSNLNIIFEKYGFKINQDLVLDSSNEVASFTTGFFTMSANYPLWPKIMSGKFNPDEPAVKQLESLSLPWASSLEILDQTKVHYLAQTTPRSWIQYGVFDINPQQNFQAAGDIKTRNLALILQGSVTSPYGAGTNPDAKIIVVGDSDFISEQFVGITDDNLTFFQNIVDSVSLDDDLISIRSKSVTSRPIDELNDSEKASIRYFNIFGLTVAVLIIGFIRYYLRNKRHPLE